VSAATTDRPHANADAALARKAAPHPTTLTDHAVIQLDRITRTYRVGGEIVRALDSVSLTLERGTFTAIMGSSGSGKSTMLNILGCLDRPNSGSYTLDGEPVADLPDGKLSEIRLQKLGFVFQSFHLIPQLTVRENIELPLYYQGRDRAESLTRAEALAERVGLGQRLNHRPTELSGGQQQRVAIARALANEPKLLLADEPTGNLDSTTTEQIMSLLVELNDTGTTIVMVTHEPEIAQHCPTHLHMRDGRVDRAHGPGVAVESAETPPTTLGVPAAATATAGTGGES
jgi:putative ABC transport system ATP-binding protein